MENPELVGVVRESLFELAAWLRSHQLKLLGAVALVALGWVLGLLMRAIVSRLLHALGRMVPGRSGLLQVPPSRDSKSVVAPGPADRRPGTRNR